MLGKGSLTRISRHYAAAIVAGPVGSPGQAQSESPDDTWDEELATFLQYTEDCERANKEWLEAHPLSASAQECLRLRQVRREKEWLEEAALREEFRRERGDKVEGDKQEEEEGDNEEGDKQEEGDNLSHEGGDGGTTDQRGRRPWDWSSSSSSSSSKKPKHC